ncbi:hypothetical protein Tco_1344130 [Tanacetum coccineum]
MNICEGHSLMHGCGSVEIFRLLVQNMFLIGDAGTKKLWDDLCRELLKLLLFIEQFTQRTKAAQKDTYHLILAKANYGEHVGHLQDGIVKQQVPGTCLQCDTSHVLLIARCEGCLALTGRYYQLWLVIVPGALVMVVKECYFEDGSSREKSSIFESDKFVLSKNQMYVGKGYAVNAMFKLNVMVVKNDINKMNSSALLRFEFLMYGLVVLEYKRQESCSMISIDDEIDSTRKKKLNQEEAKGQETRNRLDPILFLFMLEENEPTSYENRYKWIFKKKKKADGIVDNIKQDCTTKGLDSLWTRRASIQGLWHVNVIDDSVITDLTLAYAVRYPTVIEGYSDANWISDIKDSTSTSGYMNAEEEGMATSIRRDIQGGSNEIIASDIIDIDNTLMESISIDYVGVKGNIVDPITKGLSRELVNIEYQLGQLIKKCWGSQSMWGSYLLVTSWPHSYNNVIVEREKWGALNGIVGGQFLEELLVEPAYAHDHDGTTMRLDTFIGFRLSSPRSATHLLVVVLGTDGESVLRESC